MPKNINVIIINSRKFDKTIHRTWKAKLIEQTHYQLTLAGKFSSTISHSDLGVIRRETVSIEFFWFDRWYNVFRFHNPDGSLRNFYCNICLPPVFSEDKLDYVDLDIDLVVWQDFSYKILDVEEFEANALKYSYTEQMRAKIQETLTEIISLIDNRMFPFDYTV